MKNRRCFCFICLLLAFFVIVACTEYDDAAVQDFSVEEDTGVLRVHVSAEPQTLDPAFNMTVAGGTYINHLFEGLMRFDENGQLVFAAAKSYTVSDDELVYTFKLRPDAVWSDGKKLIADDWVYSWRRLVDPQTGSGYSYILEAVSGVYEIIFPEKGYIPTRADIEAIGIRSLDEETLEITLSKQCPYFPEIVAFPSTYPIRKDIIDRYGSDWYLSPSSFICNGPYVLDYWNHSDTMTLVKNVNYRDSHHIVSEKIVFYLSSDSNFAYNLYEKGDVVFSGSIPADKIAMLDGNDEFYKKVANGVSYVCFNTNKPPFDNALVRQAFSFAVDRDYLVSIISGGKLQVAEGFTPSSASSSASSFDKMLDITTAKDLLTLAGYPNGKDFPKVEYIYSPGETNQTIAEALKLMWEKLGINVTVTELSWNKFITARYDGKYMLANYSKIGDFIDPVCFFDTFTSSSLYNDAMYYNESFDEIIKLSDYADGDERLEFFRLAENILAEDMPMTPLFFLTDVYLMKNTITGFYSNPLGHKYFMYATVN